jgi:hypothetical protein
LTIGKVAKHAGVGIDTVRFYERKGPVAEPSRGASGYRHKFSVLTTDLFPTPRREFHHLMGHTESSSSDVAAAKMDKLEDATVWTNGIVNQEFLSRHDQPK